MREPLQAARLPEGVRDIANLGELRSFTREVEDLYRSDSPRLWRSLFAYAQSRAVADDAVAEAFAQLLRRGEAVRDPKAWVWKSAFRIAAGDLERQRRTANELVVDLSYDAPDDAIDLIVALRALSEMQRKAVVLHDYAGYRAAEVARMVGSTEAAVRVHLMRGRRRLRVALAEQ
jgi:RNA polymerase sigma-70 factor (ECF subfamily)